MESKIREAIDLANAGNWNKAHSIAQSMNNPLACWLHANLHREEGDRGNAQYWYNRASKPFSNESFADERNKILAAIGD